MSVLSVLGRVGNALREIGGVTAEVLQMPFVGALLKGTGATAGTVQTILSDAGKGVDALGSVTGILSLMESVFPTVNDVKGGPAKLQAATPIVGSIVQAWAESNLPGHNDVIVTSDVLNQRVQNWTSATADLLNCFGKK